MSKTKIVAIDMDGTLTQIHISNAISKIISSPKGEILRKIISKEFALYRDSIFDPEYEFDTHKLLPVVADKSHKDFIYRVPQGGESEIEYSKASISIKEWTEDFCKSNDIFRNKENIAKNITELVKNGIKVAIATYCIYPPLAIEIVNQIGLVDSVKSQIEIICGMPKNTTAIGKNNHLKMIKEIFLESNMSNEELYLLDDNYTNFNIASKVGYSGRVVFPRQTVLFSDDIIRDIAGEDAEYDSDSGSYDEPDEVYLIPPREVSVLEDAGIIGDQDSQEHAGA